LKEEYEQGWLGVREFTGLREEFRRSASYQDVLAYQSKDIDGEELLERMRNPNSPPASIDRRRSADWQPRFTIPTLDYPSSAAPRVPLFTHFAEEITDPQPDLVLYQDAEMIIFPNKCSGRTAMSELHLIVIPRERIFDAVTLGSEHIDLLQQIILKVKDLFQKDSFRQYLCKEQEKDQWLLNEAIGAGNLEFFVQPYPMASTGHFCIHCCAEKLKTKGRIQQKDKNL
jgi:hypothetical protein